MSSVNQFHNNKGNYFVSKVSGNGKDTRQNAQQNIPSPQ